MRCLETEKRKDKALSIEKKKRRNAIKTEGYREPTDDYTKVKREKRRKYEKSIVEE